MNKFFFSVLQRLFPGILLSSLAGRLANCQQIWLKNFLIKGFVKKFAINLTEAHSTNYQDYSNFNAFFTRALSDQARVFPHNDSIIASPCDGSISQIDVINHNQLIQAKGHYYTLEQLLVDSSLAQHFLNGHFATLYLAPHDYHRVHMPLTGKLTHMIYVPGRLFSVNTLSAHYIPGIFARNERVISIFETAAGKMAVIMIGAMLVGSIVTTWAGVINPKGKHRSMIQTEYDLSPLAQGEQMGYFQFGSTVILLFEKNTIEWDKILACGQAIQVGNSLGHIIYEA